MVHTGEIHNFDSDKANNMNLEEIERRLAYCRIELNLKLVRDERNSLQPPVIDKIERGGNYKLSSLLRYVNALGMELIANGTIITKIEDLGAFLKSERKKNGQTLAEVKWGTRRGYREINTLEGGGGTRMNLWNYLNKLNYKINFELNDKYGIAKEKEREKEARC